MTYIEWRRNIYTPLALCSKELASGTSAIVQKRIICFNLYYCINKYGKGIVSMVLAHTVRNRRCTINNDDIIDWADGISRIGPPKEYNNEKRNFHELLLRCNDKTVIELCKTYINYTENKENAYA